MNSNWFENWFDTDYYHLLYRHRDDEEAHEFIDALLACLNPLPGQTALDLACGRGRHSVYLNSKNLDVTGVDLSKSSIAFAKKYENETLHFEVQDMRKSMGENKYDYVFNLFTSFGYFENSADDVLVLKNIYDALKPGGVFIFDFLNTSLVKNSQGAHTKLILDGVEFEINKEVSQNNVIKHIHINDRGTQVDFYEKVKLIEVEWFKEAFEKTGFAIQSMFGNYKLANYNERSERLIILAKKN
jgi:SAM-dependent methyltransferase